MESPIFALHQMSSGSEILRALSGKPDLGISYILLAGNSSIVPAALELDGA